MVKFTINTTLKLFIAKAGITSFNVKADLYSDAKEDWIAGGTVMGFDFPIRVIGGDPVGGGQFAGDLYFLRDGWKIRPDEASHTLTITGNLFLDEGETGNIVVPTVGAYTVIAQAVRSNLVMSVSSEDVATAVWAVLLEAGFSASRILRIIAAATAGKSSGGPGSPVFRNLVDGTNQLTGVADSNGNRTSATYGA